MERPLNGPVKVARTFEEQVNILQSRGIIIDNYEKAVNPLFSQIVSLYEFDKKLRHLLLGAIEGIEIAFRTHIAYHHSHKYSPLGYHFGRTDGISFFLRT